MNVRQVLNDFTPNALATKAKENIHTESPILLLVHVFLG